VTEGTWPERCEQRAFVAGAKWWEYQTAGASMWQSHQREAEDEAVRRFGDPLARPVSDRFETLALISEHRLHLTPMMDGGWRAQFPRKILAQPFGEGPTIGEAVLACVSKLKALDLSDRDP
jgi:hypothetical protein